MTEDTLARILIIAGSLGAVLALAFGIWVGLGSPGLYDKHAPTGRAPRDSPWRWLLGGRQRARSSRFDAVLREGEVEEGEDEGDGEAEGLEPYSSKPDFSRGRRFKR
ncbi:hypothetical protein [Candidatus Palauibacter sp.]|uniref:hypothetical protein n=1 Tax=Candidatus Palauibacter sp. TaxID=3101350 RepID=UPI003B51ECBE